MRIYKTGELCPCCGQPIKLTDPDELYAYSVFMGVLGLGLSKEREVTDGKQLDQRKG